MDLTSVIKLEYSVIQVALLASSYMQIAIVTDDLTSATDGAVALAEAGWRVQVSRGIAVEPYPVLSVDVATRGCARDEAVLRTQLVGACVERADIIVKQFDSTLRGHVAAETLALLAMTGRSRVVAAPAFPSAGRTTVNGCQLVDGIPVAESDYARDPLNPVTSSDVVKLFAAEKAQRVLSGRDSAVVHVLDATTEEDLDRIVEEYAGNRDILLAGSTGIVRALARCGPKPPSLNYSAHLRPSRRVLFVVGSMNPRSREQLEVLRAATALPVFEISDSHDAASVVTCLAHKFETEPIMALTTVRAPGNSAGLAKQLGLVAGELLRRSIIEAMVVTGGDVFGAVLDSIGARSLEVIKEIEPGIPICKVGYPHPFVAISKAGGFGSPTVLSKALVILTSGS